MPKTIEKTAYQYSELSDRAKERARDWWIGCMDANDLDFVVDDFERVCEALGVSLAYKPVRLHGGGTRDKPQVFWSLGYTQGDYASFEGSYGYAKGSAKAVRAYAPQDAELHGIADRLHEVQRKHFYRLEASIKPDGRGHYSGREVEVTSSETGNDASEEAREEIADCMRDLAAWLYDALRAEHEHQCSEEAIAEDMAANEYDFDEDGRRT